VEFLAAPFLLAVRAHDTSLSPARTTGGGAKLLPIEIHRVAQPLRRRSRIMLCHQWPETFAKSFVDEAKKIAGFEGCVAALYQIE
jgi:hypothetical protein